ncbi:MAG: hypothetical protein M1839_009118 [Geoglossum umbratile]|nr:MAG: hypothetical protein M1839_009118 [Geoglossum umbratile]
MVFKQHDLAVRIQALALVEEGVTVKRVMELTGLARATVYDLKRKTRQRGYDPAVSRVLKMEYVEDAPRSGRPKKNVISQGVCANGPLVGNDFKETRLIDRDFCSRILPEASLTARGLH